MFKALLSLAVVSFLTVFFLPYPYGAIGFILFWVFMGIWCYLHWKDDYAPRGNWLAGAFAVNALSYIWDFTTPYFLGLPPSFHTNGGSIAMRIIRLGVLAFIFYDFGRDYFRRRNWDRKKKWEDLTNAELPWLYVWYAKRFGDGLNSPDDKSKQIDEAYGATWNIYLELKKRGLEVKSLQKLLKHKNDSVRGLTARYLYWIDKERPLRIMDEIGAKNNELGETMRKWAEDCRAGKILTDAEILAKRDKERSEKGTINSI